MTWISDWPAQAACRGADPDFLFVQGAAQNRVKTMCAGCTVRTECLADALDNEIEVGVWGGMTERERRALLRKRPDVVSWRSLLETARANHEAGIEVKATTDNRIPTQQVPTQADKPVLIPVAATRAPQVLDLRGEKVADNSQTRQVVDIF